MNRSILSHSACVLRNAATGGLLVLAACTSTAPSDTKDPPAPPPTVFGGDRPVTIQVPDAYDAAMPHPLLVSLHGYQSSGAVEELYLRLGPVAMERGYLFLTPDGTFDSTNSRFWNAWPGMHEGSTVDDVEYLTTLISDVRSAYNIDPSRIYLTGHSNGGGMTYRMACELSDTLAAIGVLAGYMPLDSESVCKPTSPLHVLSVHGDQDPDVSYETNDWHLGAEDAVAFWAKHNGCTGVAEGEPLDLTKDEEGAETKVVRGTGCAAGSTELWTLEGAKHVPTFKPSYAEALFDHFDAHTK